MPLRALAVAAVSVTTALGSGACSGERYPVPGPSRPAGSASGNCAEPTVAPLPSWARAGFGDPSAPVRHLAGVRGAIVAVPFGWPLRDHRPSGSANKILWVAKAGSGPLHIRATEEATGEVAVRELPDGPGPSVVDMPSAGCWHFVLSWDGQRDELFVRYLAGSAS